MTEERQRRPVCEAVPAFNLDAALKAAKGRVTLIRWVTPDEATVGSGDLLQIEGTYQLTFEFGKEPKGYTLFPAVVGSNGVTERRRRLICSGCRKLVSVIYYFNQAWGCRTCHGLGYSSQQRNPGARLVQDYDALMVAAHRPRREGEHQDTYDRRGAEARAKLATIKASPHVMVDGRPEMSLIRTIYYS